MRKGLIKAALTIALMIMAMLPLATRLSRIQSSHRYNDAEQTVNPMIRLYDQNPVNRAAVPVEGILDIEQIWEIEDSRTEAERPLVAGMRNGGSALGYDRMSQTFYCTIGSAFAEEVWPELELFVRPEDENEALTVGFVDDYSYDYPSDSVKDGYRYELFAYTQSEYQYFGIVFTGLPVVCLHTESDIEGEDGPAVMSVSSAQHDPIVSMALVHERGGGYVLKDSKLSYRIEFQRIKPSGRNASQDLSVLGMEADSDWLLLSNAKDPRCVMNHLAFKLWNNWIGDEHAFMKQHSEMVEVFLNDEYQGVSQLMERHDEEREIVENGGSLATDCCVRLIGDRNESDRPVKKISSEVFTRLECRYAARNDAQRAFDLFENYSRMSEWLDEGRATDEAFIRAAEESVDVESFMSYFLFHLMVGLTDDNIGNNIYFYILNEDGKMLLHPAPWDMDWAFFYGYFGEAPTSEKRFNLGIPAYVRMLDLNVMNCRETLHRLYRELRESAISDEAITTWIRTTEQEINASGAYLRDSEKWRGEAAHLNLDDMLNFELDQARIIGDLIQTRWPVTQK